MPIAQRARQLCDGYIGNCAVQDCKCISLILGERERVDTTRHEINGVTAVFGQNLFNAFSETGIRGNQKDARCHESSLT